MKKFLFLCLFLLPACRNSSPPTLSIICLGDGFGGADCALSTTTTTPPEGCHVPDLSKPTQVYCPPSSLTNFWMTTQTDAKNFTAWCYGTSPKSIAPAFDQTMSRIRGPSP